MSRTRHVHHRLFAAALATAVLAGAAAASQAAGGFSCRASAIRASGAGVTALEPTVANAAGTPCASDAANANPAAVPAISAATLGADSASAQTTAASGSATAQARVINPSFSNAQAGFKASQASATAQLSCVNGSPASSATSQVNDLFVNGTSYGTVTAPMTIPVTGGTLYVNQTIAGTTGPTQRALELKLAPTTLNPAGVDLVMAEASAGATGSPCGTGSGGGSGSGSAGGSGGSNVGASGPGQADGVAGSLLGRSSGVSAGGLSARQAAARLALACTARKLVLIDVLIRGHHVALFGAADASLVGRTVTIGFTKSGKPVAHAVVGRDGFFGTTAPLPPAKIRYTNRATYQASAGTARSEALKLTRRMIVESVSTSAGRVRIRGHVVKPLARPAAIILIQQRVSCKHYVTVKRLRLGASGAFSASVSPPPYGLAAVYRAVTRVRAVARNPKTFPTSTLPRVVVVH